MRLAQLSLFLVACGTAATNFSPPTPYMGREFGSSAPAGPRYYDFELYKGGVVEKVSAAVDPDNYPNCLVSKSLFKADQVWNLRDYDSAFVDRDDQFKKLSFLGPKMVFVRTSGRAILYDCLDKDGVTKSCAFRAATDTIIKPYSETEFSALLNSDSSARKAYESGKNQKQLGTLLNVGGLILTGAGVVHTLNSSDASEPSISPLLLLGVPMMWLGYFVYKSSNSTEKAVDAYNTSSESQR